MFIKLHWTENVTLDSFTEITLVYCMIHGAVNLRIDDD